MAAAASINEEVLRQQREATQESNRREFIIKALLNAANQTLGVKQTLYYARSGQYGKDKKVFCKVGSQYLWADPATWKGTGNDTLTLAYSPSREILIAGTSSLDEEVSYCVFARHYTPTWSISEEEILTIYQRKLKHGR